MRLSIRCVAGVVSVCLYLGTGSLFAIDRTVKVCARDERGNAVADASVVVGSNRMRSWKSDASGCVAVQVDSAKVVIEVSHE